MRIASEQEPENNSSSDSKSSEDEHGDTASNERPSDISAPKNNDVDSGIKDLVKLEKIEIENCKPFSAKEKSENSSV